jgi:hypothetical protein
MLKKINIFLILDFNIRGYSGLGIHHKLFLTSLTFRLAISVVFEHSDKTHTLPGPSFASFSRLDKVDATR